MSNTETVSEKRRRGRPRSHNRLFLDGLPGSLRSDRGTLRTKLAKVNEYMVVGLVDKLLEEADQRVFLGGSPAELMAGTSKGSPRGWSTFAVEFGRWVDASETTDEQAAEHLREVAQAVRNGQLTFGDCAAHYRKCRLGAKAGNARALTMHLARALDSYLKRFPETTSEMIETAVSALGRICCGKSSTTNATNGQGDSTP